MLGKLVTKYESEKEMPESEKNILESELQQCREDVKDLRDFFNS